MEKCKKAAELKSTSDLKLSKHQWSYLFKKYTDLPGIVYAGRKFAYNPMRELPASQVPLALYELERQLKLNGYIRSDINGCTFAIGALYKRSMALNVLNYSHIRLIVSTTNHTRPSKIQEMKAHG